MDPRAYCQGTAWAAVTGILMAMFLFQATGGLKCYSCLEEEDSGCSAANIAIIQCAAPMNICTEYLQIISTDAFMVSQQKKGCSLGQLTDFSSESFNGILYYKTQVKHCSTDLCNIEQPNSTITRPALNTTEPGDAVLNGMECFSCLSVSVDQCSPENADKVKCSGDKTRCYKGNVTITVNEGESSKAIHIKTCALGNSCTSSYSVRNEHTMMRQKGSCCSGRFCNGPETSAMATFEPTSQVPCSSVSPLFLMLNILTIIIVL